MASGGSLFSSSMVIRLIKDCFTEKGVPVRLTTDGGPQFVSQEFSKFCKDWGIIHDPSSPYHHHENGSAEAAVKAIKSLLSKCSSSVNIADDSFRRGLIEFRNTPLAHGLSPAQLFFGKLMRSHVPCHFRAFRKEWQKDREIADQAATRLKEKAKVYFDQHAHNLPELPLASVVLMQNPRTKRWTNLAEVISQDTRRRSYNVKTESGRVFWRNRRFFCLFNPA